MRAKSRQLIGSRSNAAARRRIINGSEAHNSVVTLAETRERPMRLKV